MHHERRLTSIDALRGLAALAVVFWHWQHFFLPASPPFDQFPIFWLFSPLYQYGWWGVELFFSISGFIFFRLYADAIARGHVDGWTFTVLRFSRLYPLHLATLLFVAFTQLAYHAINGRDFVFPSNSLAHFLGQLFLVSAWADKTSTFNGPTWSIIVEVLLYAMFFGLAKFRLTRLPAIAAICAIGSFLIDADTPLGRGALSFFIGGLCAEFVRAAQSSDGLPRGAYLYLPATLLSFVVAHMLYPAATLPEFIAFTFLFPGLIGLLAFYEDVLAPVTAQLDWLGRISYSSYLLHFPLQLTIVTFAAATGITIDFLSPVTFVAFFAILIIVSLCSFTLFEKPAMALLRRVLPRYLPRRNASVALSVATPTLPSPDRSVG